MITEINGQLSQIGLDRINIDGGNIELEDVSFGSLIDHWAGENPELKGALTTIQTISEEVYDQAKNYQPSVLEVKNNRVVIPDGTIIHSTQAVTGSAKNGYVINDSLKSISVAGILATEWFGILESANECVFCASAAVIRNNISPTFEQRIKEQNQRRGDRRFCFYFDTKSPLMQKLLRLDYYEYARMLEEEPEKINETYSKEEIEMFETLIRPYSKSGENYHFKQNESKKSYDWVAIPGGISAELINGISIGHNNPAIDFVFEISEMFPNATFFGEDGYVLAMPKSQMKEDGSRKKSIARNVDMFKLQKQLESKSEQLKKYIDEIKLKKDKIQKTCDESKNSKFGKKLVESYASVNEILENKLQELQAKLEKVTSKNCNSSRDETIKRIEIADLQLAYFEDATKPLNMLGSIVGNMEIASSKPQGQITQEVISSYEKMLVRNQKLLDDYIEANKMSMPVKE